MTMTPATTRTTTATLKTTKAAGAAAGSRLVDWFVGQKMILACQRLAADSTCLALQVDLCRAAEMENLLSF